MSAAVLQQRRVVVAEPLDPVGVHLAMLLDDEGFEVVGHTHEPQAAVALAGALSPDVVIVDVAIAPPERQGASVEAITAAAAIAGQQVPAVIVLSPAADRESVSRLVAAGAAAILRRPLTKAALLPAIEMAIARHAQAASLRAQLAEVSSQLASRKVIDRAKGHLMTSQGFTEPQAFRWLQKEAMDRRLPMTDIAAEVLTHPTVS
jgi:AmiR/NasT family two-component response regulator